MTPEGTITGGRGEPFAAGLKRRSCRASWPSPKRRNPKRQSTRGAVRCGFDTGLYGWIPSGNLTAIEHGHL